MLVYLFGPISGMSAQSQEWREAARSHLTENNLVVFDPYAALMGSPNDQVIVEIDEFVVSRADVLCGILSPDSPGSLREVERAISRGIPVFAMLDGASTSPFYLDQRIDTFEDIQTAVLAAVEYSRSSISSLPHTPSAPRVVFELYDRGKWVNPPGRSHDGDAGYDLFCSEDVDIEPDGYAWIPSNLKMQPPPDVWAMVLGRSSAYKQRNLLVIPSVVDWGYRGHLIVQVINMGSSAMKVARGERVGQIVFFPLTVPVPFMGTVQPSDRGQGGFGSTGT